jgi:hypothetical protein
MRRQKTGKGSVNANEKTVILKELYPIFSSPEDKYKDFSVSPTEFGERLAREAIKKINDKVTIK